MRKIYTFQDVFSTMNYPAGESHVQIREDFDDEIYDDDVILFSRCKGFEDIGNILTANDLLKDRKVVWYIPYFPFGRHDRRRDKRDGLELKIAMNMVKDLDVVTLDPHSDVLGMMWHIPQSVVVEYFKYSGLIDDNTVVIIPDQGATKKASTWLNDLKYVQGIKHRDVATGKLSGFGIQGGNSGITGHDCIIIDDICDGGGTFLGLANVLMQRGAKRLTLAVTHGLFTRGKVELKKYFTKIESADSIEALKWIYNRSTL